MIRIEFFVYSDDVYLIFIGLDPALPLFASGDSATHLSAGDAKFVGMWKHLIIHMSKIQIKNFQIHLRYHSYWWRIFRNSLEFGSCWWVDFKTFHILIVEMNEIVKI